MTELIDDIDELRRVGSYDTTDEVVEDALRSLMLRRPELRIELGVEKYRQGAVSLNRSAEIAGLSTEAFKETLAERGVERDVEFLSADERTRILDDL